MPIRVLTIDFKSTVNEVDKSHGLFSREFLVDTEDAKLLANRVDALHQSSELKGSTPQRLVILFDAELTTAIGTDFILTVFGHLIRSVLIYSTQSSIEFRNFPELAFRDLEEAISIIKARLNERTFKEKVLDCIAYKSLGSFFTQ